ncbi:MAG: translocation and assembly module TamB [Lentimonas sp.]
MKRNRYRRLLIQGSLIGLFGLAVLLFTSRWWLPAVLPSVLARFDVQVDAVSMTEAGGLRLTQLGYTSDSVAVEVDAVELPAWTVYLWERTMGAGVGDLPLSADRLTVRIVESADAAAAESDVPDLVAIYQEVNRQLALYEVWLPVVTLGEAEVFVGAKSVCVAREVRVHEGRVSASVKTAYWPQAIVLTGDLSSEAEWLLDVEVAELGLHAKSRLVGTEAALDLSTVISHGKDALNVAGTWGVGQLLPQRVSVESQAFSVNPDWFTGMEAVEADALNVSGLNALWEDGRYQMSVQLGADVPVEGETTMPLRAQVSASGDLEFLRIEQLRLHAEWGQADLSNPLEIDLKGRGVTKRAELTAALDLSKQSQFPATGVLRGKVQVVPDPTKGLDLTFDLTGEDLGYEQYHLAGLSVSGGVLGSTVRLDHLVLDLLADTPEERVELSGGGDWEARTLDLNYTAALGADWLNAQLDEKYFSDELKCAGRVWGSWDAPQLKGQLEPVTVNHPLFQPFVLEGQLSSMPGGVYEAQGSAKCDGATTEIDLTAQRRDGVCSVEIKRFVMSDPALPQLNLLAPAIVRYRTAGDVLNRLQVEPVHLSADGGHSIEIDWRAGDGFLFSINKMTSARMDRWLKQLLPEFDVDALELRLTQLKPEILGSVKVHAQCEVESEEVLRLDLVGEIEESGIRLEQLALQFEQQSQLSGQIALPVRLQIPQNGVRFWGVVEGGHLLGALKGQTTPAFTEWLSAQIGVGVGDAVLDLNVSGSLSDPRGTLDLRVAALDLGDHFTAAKLPVLNELELQALIDEEGLQIKQFELLVHESEVQGHGGVTGGDALKVLTDHGTSWEAWSKHAYGRVDFVDWKLEKWIHLFPDVFRQSGVVNGHVELKSGLDLSGNLRFEDFGLRPTSVFPLIDRMGGELTLVDRKLTVQQASARIGSSPVRLTGWIDGADLEHPLWEVKAVGANVPLVRTTDLILRSDVDLIAKRLHADDVPELSGELNFTPSTLLVEFDPFAPSVKSGRSSQPPYFSITTPSIADWTFDLVGKGHAFLRVRSPYCRARVSANLTLQGTLIKPELLGSLRVAEGDVLFPSVKMDLDNGSVTIERTRPHEVQLDFSGIAQVSSYVITMEVEQSLQDPSITFSSTPVLPNSEIVQLLATGSNSGGGVGAVGIYLGKGLLGVGAGGVDSGIADRLSIDVGEAGGRDGGNTFGVQYRLTDDLSINGGYDIHEAYNLDLMWSVFKR